MTRLVFQMHASMQRHTANVLWKHFLFHLNATRHNARCHMTSSLKMPCYDWMEEETDFTFLTAKNNNLLPSNLRPSPSVQTCIHTRAELPMSTVIYSCTALVVATNSNEERAPTRMQGSNWALNVLHEILGAETNSGLNGMQQEAAAISVHF